MKARHTDLKSELAYVESILLSVIFFAEGSVFRFRRISNNTVCHSSQVNIYFHKSLYCSLQGFKKNKQINIFLSSAYL
jgi:hypothetical protein